MPKIATPVETSAIEKTFAAADIWNCLLISEIALLGTPLGD
jgi:hypothetical protein